MTKTARPPLYYGWIVTGVVGLVLLIAAGGRSAPGVFLVPMQELGWPISTLSAAVSLGLLMFGLGGPLSGWLMDRYGPRRVTLAGLAVVAVAYALSSVIHAQWQLYLFWGLLSGIGTGVIGSVLGATVAARWFVRQRGLVTGIFGAATSAGQLMFIPLLTALAAGPGWRASSLGIAALALVLVVPVWFLLRDAPADLGLAPDGDPRASAAKPPAPEAGVMRRALRSRDFWLLAGTFFVCGATSNGLIGTHFIKFCTDAGLTAGYAAGTLALMGAFNFVGTVASGWLTDRFDPRALLGCYYAFRGVSLLLLLFIPPGPGLVAFAVLFGLDYIATVPPTTALVADRFGRQNLGTVYGWVFCAHQVGAALGSWLGGVAREDLGGYGAAFVAAGVLAVAGAVLAQGVGRPLKAAPAGD